MINVSQTIIGQYAATSTIARLIENMDFYFDPRTDFGTFLSFVFDVETAQGFGLDICGRIVGAERYVNVPSGTPNPGGYAWTPGVYTMDDDDFRAWILAKALANIISVTAPALNQLLTNLFEARGRCYVRDTGSMTMVYTFEFWLHPFEYVIISQYGIVPRPAGVLATIFQVDVSFTFGFQESLQLQPFDQGTFYVS